MKFLFEERNAYQYKGHTLIQTSSGYRIKDGKDNWVEGEFDTDTDAKEHIDNLKESFEEDTIYEYVSSKSVEDSDGFMTDYTWYKTTDGTHVFVFGDTDLYKPEDGYFDFETDNDYEAEQWFSSYNGFADDEDDLVVSESVETDKPVHLKLSGKVIEIPIEDTSEVGELGHPIQQGIGDPRAKREKELKEATAVLDKPLSTFNGTLSSVLLAHKDEVDTLFDRTSAIEFLDRIQPEVKSRAYVDKVKQDIMRSRGNPVEYFYNIILKGDGDGTEKGGVVTKKSQTRKWARESVPDDFWERALWWENLIEPDAVSYGYRIRCSGYTSHAGRSYFNSGDRTLTFGGMKKAIDGFSVLQTKTSAVTRSSEVTFLTEEAAEQFAKRMGLDGYYIGRTRKAYDLYEVNTEFGKAYATRYFLESRLGKIPTYLLANRGAPTQEENLTEAIDDWSLAVYDNDSLLKDKIWSVADALEFIHDNGGNIIKKLENGEETVIWKDGKAVGGDFIGMDYNEDGSTIYAQDGQDVPTHEPSKPFSAFKWMYGEQLAESFNYMIDLDRLATDVANLLDDSVLGDNWIEVFPTGESRPVGSNGYILPVEVTGPNDDCRKVTFTSRGNVVDIKFRNGSEAKCYDATEIARFIAGEFGLSLDN